MRHLIRTLLCMLALSLCALSSVAHAQSFTSREILANKVRSLSPAVCRQVPEPRRGESLDQQEEFWNKVQSCLNADGVERSTRLLSGGPGPLSPEAQAAIQRQAVEEVGRQALVRQADEGQREVTNQQDFLGWSWGVGFGVGVADHDRVDQADIVNNVVRVSKDSSQQARAFLEYHWFPERWQGESARAADDTIVRGHGPFVAVSSRDDKLLSGVGVGWMFAFRDKNKSEGFGIALGAILDNDVPNLADGFEDGQPPPNGETAIRMESKSRVSYVLFFTRSF
jgi:hypothetical protein